MIVVFWFVVVVVVGMSRVLELLTLSPPRPTSKPPLAMMLLGEGVAPPLDVGYVACVMCGCVKKEKRRGKKELDWFGLDCDWICGGVPRAGLDGVLRFSLDALGGPKSIPLSTISRLYSSSIFFRLSIIDLRSLVPRPPPLPSNTPRSPSLSCSRLASFHLVLRTSAVRAFLLRKNVIHPPYRCLGHFFSSFPLPLSAVVHWLASLRATIYLQREGEEIEPPILSRFRKEIRSIPSDNRLAFPPGFRSSILREDTHVLRVSLPCEETPIVSRPFAVRKLYPSLPVCCDA